MSGSQGAPESDRERWDRKWSGEHGDGTPPEWLAELGLPSRGRALDVACGSGRVGLWLAEHGLDVLGIDVSPVGLARFQTRARERGLRVETRAVDVRSEPLPVGPFDVISLFHYLERSVFPALVERLAVGGWLLVQIPTRCNLERHAKPPREFLLDEGELESLLRPLEIVHAFEGWVGDRALARAAARRR